MGDDSMKDLEGLCHKITSLRRRPKRASVWLLQRWRWLTVGGERDIKLWLDQERSSIEKAPHLSLARVLSAPRIFAINSVGLAHLRAKHSGASEEKCSSCFLPHLFKS